MKKDGNVWYVEKLDQLVVLVISLLFNGHVVCGMAPFLNGYVSGTELLFQNVVQSAGI